jgi:3D-(3,5/4)-trihydroxycyclohexane-1,2-dione acylhydrolase (decyclizing)
MGTVRLTMAQALVKFLANQYTERRFFGIFGHANVAGVGRALQQYPDELTYYQARNEQAMAHAASAYPRQKNRLQTFGLRELVAESAPAVSDGASAAAGLEA